MPHTIVIADPLGAEGVELLRADPTVTVDELEKDIDTAELHRRVRQAAGLIVRSATQVTAELLAAAPELSVVVRAGAGVDNIDVNAATARGVVVMNTPGGNTVAAAEHTMALLLALARGIPAAHRSLAEGRWERSRFVGWELRDKTLGLVGVGRIGAEVAARAIAFKMRVIGYDPYISRETAAARGIQLETLDDLLAMADVVSLHLPLGNDTHHVLDATRIARMKRGSHVINCARGGLVDEAALLQALDSGHLGGAALDVFEAEPKPSATLVTHPRVVVTPHLGASTSEAQSSVGIQAARQILGVLHGTSFENAINVPIRDPAVLERLAPHLRLAERMGALQAQLLGGGIREVNLDVAGQLEEGAPIRLAYLRGLLTRILGSNVNYVNAPFLAQERGVRVAESRSAQPADYVFLITATVVTDAGTQVLAGTVVARESPRLIEIDGFRTDAIPEGNLLLVRSLDRPGVIGEIGSCCGEYGLNISEFRLGRRAPGGEALSVITLDDTPAEAALTALRQLPHVLSVALASL